MTTRYLSLSLALALTCTVQTGWAQQEVIADQGMVISCPMYGQIWGSSSMRTAIREVRSLGVNAIQIHPYARIHKNGTISFTPAKATGYLDRAAKIAAEEKIKLFWKPHLAYWGSFSWRGAITFAHESQWQRFFVSYEKWIIDQAKFANQARVPIFAVGTELDRTLHRPEWRAIIKNVRKVYRGKIVYAANWDSYTKVPFWKDVDLIGIQAYFPMSTAGKVVTKREVKQSWQRLLAQLELYSKQQQRPILFTELGYTRSTAAGEKPWKPELIGSYEQAIRTQKVLLGTALRQIKTKKFIVGAYLWKWMPGFAPWEKDFAMREEQVQALIRRTWN